MDTHGTYTYSYAYNDTYASISTYTAASTGTKMDTHGTESDKECFRYVVEHEAGSSQKPFQEGLLRDCLRDGSLHPERRAEDGRGMRLQDFCDHPNARKANLNQLEVIALRVYTTAAFVSINQPLRDTTRFEKREAHPLPLHVQLIKQGIGKLRAVEAELPTRNSVVDLYRGMKGVYIPAEFQESGGSELAPMSTTSNLEVAVQYAASEQSVLLRLHTDSFMKRGANLTFLSAFPGEAEYLFPPLTYLKPKSAPQTLLVDAATFVVLDVEPVFPS